MIILGDLNLFLMLFGGLDSLYLQALAEQSRLIRLPLNRVGTITKITRAAEKLEAEVERQPKGDEIGAQLEMSGDEVLMAMQYSRRHSSLNSPFRKEKIAAY